jgi:hypothetical protein
MYHDDTILVFRRQLVVQRVHELLARVIQPYATSLPRLKTRDFAEFDVSKEHVRPLRMLYSTPEPRLAQMLPDWAHTLSTDV